MEAAQFQAFLPVISGDLVAFIASQEEIAPEEAMKRLYCSQLYAFLEQEEMKVWYYSTPMLYSLFREEETTGTIQFPDT